MDFVRFYQLFRLSGVVQKSEIDALGETFDKNNLTRWCQQGVLVKLRNGFYAFPEFIENQYFIYYIANRIYPNSYVSLHSALATHGYLPIQFALKVTSVSSQKTTSFRNPFASFDYQKMKPELLFGYSQIEDDFPYLMADPEKALLDLFYLFPNYYDTEQKVRNFALDQQMLYEDFSLQKLFDYLQRFENKALESRVNVFTRIYGL